MVVTKVTSQPMRTRRLASCREGFTCPCAGYTTRRKRGFDILTAAARGEPCWSGASGGVGDNFF